MLEQRYTTKMSSQKKTLQARFTKIRSKNGKASRLMAMIIFGVLLLSLLVTSCILALNRTENGYAMSDSALSDYLDQPIGAITADIDYADDDKVVFHYLNGFFVYNQKTNEIDLAIDLSKLDVAPHSQGDCVLSVTVDESGMYAYLESVGDMKEAEKFKKYCINLETGEVEEGTMPNGAEAFRPRHQTYETLSDPYGFCSEHCIITENYDYYITTTESSVSALQLVTHNKQIDMTSYSYLFRHHYKSPMTKQREQVEKIIPKDVQYPIGGDLHWETDSATVKKLGERINPYLKIPADTAINVAAYLTEKDDACNVYFFFFDAVNQKLYDHFTASVELLPQVAEILNNPQSDLYQKTYQMLSENFHKRYDWSYDIQALTITNWLAKDTLGEAQFYLNMSYLYYNRDPDKVKYIQDAKASGNAEHYQELYDDYLNIHQGNYHLMVRRENSELKLYVNQAPKGLDWVPFDQAFPE